MTALRHRRAGHRRAGHRRAGFSLVELLVATAIAGVVLAGGWAWCWSASSTCAAGAERLDAGSSLAFAQRLSTTELRQCLALSGSAGAGCSATAISFVAPVASGVGSELITYVWDPGRHVLWRKAPGSHVAEGVDSFSIVYLDDRDQVLPLAAGAQLPAAELRRVRMVELSATVSCGRETVAASWSVCLRCIA
jgi:prepilin-type N-terminal cleavage/methylation domain-containing protein